MPPITCLDLLDPTRRALLVALRRLGGATAEEAAAHCFLSVGAARQHLQSLEAQGLVAHAPLRHGPGRPRHRYLLTAAGEALFPKLDHEALDTLLEAIEQEAPDVRERLLRRLVEGTISRYRPAFEAHGRGSPLRGAVAVFEEAGYLPEVRETPAGIAITLHHCPIADAARRRGLLCEAEARCLAAAFDGLRVARGTFRPGGDATCTYILEPGDG
ncbi:helix-turn-helix domain-containing protein [Tepidiforma sp.]|uniref:helix-turn-helix transcriptional regulator n=1 Tax=Tepidiforma sp. TaxID=2682230 RepID=UPI0021DE4C47|nr:helix-turn-helix domain-containing protein [Tepidiforma sp.]MCX7617334.1 MarR family transcriptional regulator [Tepidiforma sp.]GIW18600.1 MAG: TrmB family transcriptional regulator [Tepidiforma sp.]